jgi:hypothetical protein
MSEYPIKAYALKRADGALSLSSIRLTLEEIEGLLVKEFPPGFLIWQDHVAVEIEIAVMKYAHHTAHAFPRLVATLEVIANGEEAVAANLARCALAFARREVKP